MLRATRKPDRSRPQIRTPFRVGLLDCWLLTERGGITLHNLVRPGNPMTTVSDPPLVVTAGGRAVDFDGSAERAAAVLLPVLAGQPMTAAVVFQADALSGTQSMLGQWTPSGAQEWLLTAISGTSMGFLQRGAAGNTQANLWGFSQALTNNTLYAVIASSDGGGGSAPTVRMAVNGRLESPSPGAPFFVGDVNNSAVTMGSQSDASSPFNGKILLAAMWNRELPAELIRQWSANPWQMFAGPDTSIALMTVVAGPEIHEHVPLGGLALGGAPLIQHVTGVWEHVPTGGFALGGAPTIGHVQFHTHVPTGGFALGGSPAISHITVGGAQVHVPTGGLALGGAPTVSRLGIEGAYAFEWVHQREIRAVVFDAVIMEHTRTVRDPINGDGVVQLHARAIGDAPLMALFTADLQRPVATGEIFLPD